jgi:peptide/nickel transport system substrate-binding protein
MNLAAISQWGIIPPTVAELAYDRRNPIFAIVSTSWGMSIMVNRLRSLVLIGLACLMAIAISSCDTLIYRSEAAQVSRIVVAVTTDPKTFNYILSEESPNIFGLTYAGLLAQEGLTGELVPELAESWEISDDGLTITYTLREGLQWSDGEPLTADDVVFTYNDLIFNPAVPTSTRDILRIGEDGNLPRVVKIDDRRVQFIAPEPFAPLLRFSGGIAIMPRHALYDSITTMDANGEPRFLTTWGTDTNPARLVSSGPYQLTGYVPSQRVTFRRNPYYWREDAQGNQQPYVEQLIWEIVESSDTAIMQFRSGGLDTIGVSPANFSLLKREEERSNFDIRIGEPAMGTTFISFNLNQGSRNGEPLVDPVKSRWFNTVEFRQAVAYAIDRQTLINNLYRGIGEPQHSPVSVQSPYYLSPEEGLKTYDHDPEQAKALLQSAGFQYNARNELLDADGNRVEFLLNVPAGGQTVTAIGAQIKRNLAEIGINVIYQPIDFGVLVDKLDTTLDWECILIGFTGSVEPHGGANFWLTDGRLHMFNLSAQPGQPPIEGRVIADWEAEISRLYIEGAQEFDEEARKAIYARTQQLAQEYLPCIYMFNPLTMSAVRDRLQGVKFSSLGNNNLESVLWNVYEIRLID